MKKRTPNSLRSPLLASKNPDAFNECVNVHSVESMKLHNQLNEYMEKCNQLQKELTEAQMKIRMAANREAELNAQVEIFHRHHLLQMNTCKNCLRDICVDEAHSSLGDKFELETIKRERNEYRALAEERLGIIQRYEQMIKDLEASAVLCNGFGRIHHHKRNQHSHANVLQRIDNHYDVRGKNVGNEHSLTSQIDDHRMLDLESDSLHVVEGLESDNLHFKHVVEGLESDGMLAKHVVEGLESDNLHVKHVVEGLESDGMLAKHVVEGLESDGMLAKHVVEGLESNDLHVKHVVEGQESDGMLAKHVVEGVESDDLHVKHVVEGLESDNLHTEHVVEGLESDGILAACLSMNKMVGSDSQLDREGLFCYDDADGMDLPLRIFKVKHNKTVADNHVVGCQVSNYSERDDEVQLMTFGVEHRCVPCNDDTESLVDIKFERKHVSADAKEFVLTLKRSSQLMKDLEVIISTMALDACSYRGPQKGLLRFLSEDIQERSEDITNFAVGDSMSNNVSFPSDLDAEKLLEAVIRQHQHLQSESVRNKVLCLNQKTLIDQLTTKLEENNKECNELSSKLVILESDCCDILNRMRLLEMDHESTLIYLLITFLFIVIQFSVT